MSVWGLVGCQQHRHPIHFIFNSNIQTAEKHKQRNDREREKRNRVLFWEPPVKRVAKYARSCHYFRVLAQPVAPFVCTYLKRHWNFIISLFNWLFFVAVILSSFPVSAPTCVSVCVLLFLCCTRATEFVSVLVQIENIQSTRKDVSVCVRRDRSACNEHSVDVDGLLSRMQYML